jgi:PhnB protein
MTGIQPELWVAIPASAMANEHGWRLGRLYDPFGHEWEIGRPLDPWPPPAARS